MPERPARETSSVNASTNDSSRKGAKERLSDAELVAAALAHQSYAFDAIVKRHASYLLQTLARLGTRQADLDDVVQNTFLDAFRSLQSLREPEKLSSWLIGIGIRRMKQHYSSPRTRWLISKDPPFDWQVDWSANISEICSPDDRVLLQELGQRLSTLSFKHRSAWILRRVEDEPLEEIAQQLKISLATTKRHIQAVDEILRREDSSTPFAKRGPSR